MKKINACYPHASLIKCRLDSLNLSNPLIDSDS